jgi:hypothetical protein
VAALIRAGKTLAFQTTAAGAVSFGEAEEAAASNGAGKAAARKVLKLSIPK